MAGKEEWKYCAEWLVRCKILPDDHKVTYGNAQVFELAQTLRDGVLICHLLNSLHPGAIDLKEFSQRPQMSQFLCLKNIRTFLSKCKTLFKLRDNDLFEPFDLFEVKDFGKVVRTLSHLSKTPYALAFVNESFPPTNVTFSSPTNDYYNLPDMATVSEMDDTEDLYGQVGEEEEDKIYDQVLGPRETKTRSVVGEAPSQRDYCIRELVETEKNYVDALFMMEENFIKSLGTIMRAEDHAIIFKDITDLHRIHKMFYASLKRACDDAQSSRIADVFKTNKTNFLIYGGFCSNLPKAQMLLDTVCGNSPIISQVVQDCQQKANQGKFRLRDLLSLPMQRVLKYHLLLKELIKKTDVSEKHILEQALDDMQDLALYINEVKRDNEQLDVIREIQNSIQQLDLVGNTELQDYGRLQKDGELKVKSHDPSNRGNVRARYIFLFDKVLLMCKPRGDTYTYKDSVILSKFRLEKSPKKTEKWPTCSFILAAKDGATAHTFVAKNDDIRKRWTDAIEMALDNTAPPDARSHGHDFDMHTFKTPETCAACSKLLRGVFFQGYRCLKQTCHKNVHKECLGRVGSCGKRRDSTRQEPRSPRKHIGKCKALQPYFGTPAPPIQPALTFAMNDVIELLNKTTLSFWEGRCGGREGFFPVAAVREIQQPNMRPAYTPSQPSQRTPPMSPAGDAHRSNGFAAAASMDDSDLDRCVWYVGKMSREKATESLNTTPDGTYLVRESINMERRGEFALSIKYVNPKHIRIVKNGHRYYIADCRLFTSITELIEYYQSTPLVENFPDVPITLKFPYNTIAKHRHLPAPLSIAIVRYDYSARTSNELSLRVGERVDVTSKSGDSRGWWKGELNGQSGYFPAAFVTEEE